MFKKIQYTKIIAPFLIIASFFATVAIQILLEEDLIAKEVNLTSARGELFNKNYQPLMAEAKKNGYEQDPSKPVQLVNFWASWCQPCLREFKSMKKALEKNENLQVLGVNQDDTIRKMIKTQKKYKLPFFSYLDIETKMAESFKVTEYPFSVMYCNGKVLKIYEGETNFNSRKIKKIIKSCQLK